MDWGLIETWTVRWRSEEVHRKSGTIRDVIRIGRIGNVQRSVWTRKVLSVFGEKEVECLSTAARM
jgi:hypothetical protein